MKEKRVFHFLINKASVHEQTVQDNKLDGKKILVVDDSEMNRIIAMTILHEYGVGITEAMDGLLAITEMKQRSFDLVLMDMQMPIMDGLEATRYIRANINTAIPIIALTANTAKGEKEKCLLAGMNDYLNKPYEEDALIQCIKKWL